MADVKSMVRDPEFQALPWEERHQLLAMKDPEYAALSSTDQAAVMGDLKTRDWWKPAVAQTGIAPQPAAVEVGAKPSKPARIFSEDTQGTQQNVMGIASPKDRKAAESARVFVKNDIPAITKTFGAKIGGGMEQSIGGAMRAYGEENTNHFNVNDSQLDQTRTGRYLNKAIASDNEQRAAIAQRGMELGDEGRAVIQAAQEDQPVQTRAGRILDQATQSIGSNIPGMTATVVTGNPALGLSMMGLQSFGQTYDESRSKGLSIADATKNAAIQGGAEVATEMLPFVALSKYLKTGNLSKEVLKAYLSDIPGEQLATSIQNASSAAYDKPNMTPQQRIDAAADYLMSNQHKEDQIDTFFTTILQNTLMAGAAKTARDGNALVSKSAPAAQPLPADGPLSRAVSRAAAPVSPIGDIVAQRRGMAGPATMSAQPAPVEPVAQPQTVAAPAPSRAAAPSSGISDLVFQSRAQRSSTLPANDGISAAPKGVANGESPAEGNQNADAVHAQGDAAQGNQEGLLTDGGASAPSTGYKKTLYRGIAERAPLHAGGMGKGEYFTSDEGIAKSYAEDFSETPGKVTSHNVELKKPFVANTLDDVFKILPEEGTTAKGGESLEDLGMRQQDQITSILSEQGYDGIVLKKSLNPRTGDYVDADEVVVFPKTLAPVQTSFPPDKRPTAPPNSILTQLNDLNGKTLGYEVTPHDGTPEGMQAAAMKNAQAGAVHPDVSANETIHLVTDAEGKPISRINARFGDITPLDKTPSPDTLSGEVSHDNGREVESVPAPVPPADTGSGDRGVEEGAKVPAAAAEAKPEVTAEAVNAMREGRVFMSPNGKTFMVADEVVGGKPHNLAKAPWDKEIRAKYPDFRALYEAAKNEEPPSTLAIKAKGLGKKEAAPAVAAPIIDKAAASRGVLETLAKPKTRSAASLAKLSEAHGRDAVNELAKSGLIAFPGKGMAELTKKGREYLRDHPKPLSPVETAQLSTLSKKKTRTPAQESKYQELSARAGKEAVTAKVKAPELSGNSEQLPEGIYKTRVKVGDSVEERYAVTAPASMGFKNGHGDELYQTLKEAKAAQEFQAKRESANVEAERVREENAAKEAKAQAAREDLDGFGDDLPPIAKGKVKAALTQQMRMNGAEMSRRDAIRKLVADGYTVGDWKGERTLQDKEGAFFSQRQMTKTGIDYAEYLIGKQEPQPSPPKSDTPASKGEVAYSLDSKKNIADLTLERVQDAFPKQQIMEKDGSFIVTTPSNVSIHISKVGEIEFNRAVAEEAYGREIGPNEYPVAEFRALTTGAIINLTEKGVSELPHEVFHAGFSLALNDRQRAAVLKSFGSEEKAAAEYQRLKDSGAFAEKKGHLFLRAIYDFFHRLRQLIAPTAKGVMQDVARGDVWKEADHRIVGSTKYAAAWHGSPHKFDKFESSKIGTGEGAQAYGAGLYFAGSRNVAEYYRATLAGKSIAINGVALDHQTGPLANAIRRVLKNVNNGVSFNEAKADAVADLRITKAPQEMQAAAELEKLSAEAVSEIESGALYHVELAPKEEEYLDWDKPLSEQSETVKTALAGEIEDMRKLYGPKADPTRMTGAEFYKGLDGTQQEASEHLHSLGIRGIKYLDGTSRGKGDGNHNYVIFNEDDVEIKAKYSLKSAVDEHDTGKLRAIVTTHPRIQALVGSVFNNGRNITPWMRTVGTMYHTAEKLAMQGKPQFKAVFDKGQDFLNDVSAFAVNAESFAPDIFPKMGTGKGIFHNLPKKDAQAIAGPLFDGTLYGGADPTHGKVFSDTELDRIYHLTPHQIELYKQARAATNQSLDDVAKSLVAKNAKTAEVDYDREMPLADMAAEVKGAIESKVEDMKAALEQYRADFDKAKEGLEGKELKSLEKEHDKFTRTQEAAISLNESLAKNIGDIATKTNSLKNRGYFPLMRFGEYTVTMKDRHGKTEFFGLYESAYKARVMADSLTKDNPNSRVVQSVMGKEKFKLYAGMNLEALQLFAEHLDKEDSEAYQEYLKQGMQNRSAMKRLIHRKGIAGYNEDAVRTLANFIVSNARHASTQYNLHDMRKLAAAIPEDVQGDVQDQAVKLYEYLTKPAEEASKLRGYLFFHYLGGSLASGIVNMTQPVMMTLPYLATKTSPAKAVKYMTAMSKFAYVDPAKMKGEIGTALRRAEADGVTAPQEIYQLTAVASNKLLASNVYVNAGLKAWGGFFAAAEAFNRRITFLSSYQISRDNGISGDAAYREAIKAVTETQGVYNKGNRPNWGRGKVGATLFTFKQFGVMYLELYNRLPLKQKMIMAGTLFLMAGMQGMPFAEDAEDIVDTIGQWAGYSTNSKMWIKNQAENALGKPAAGFLLRGVSSVMPIDLQGRMGMQNLIPGTSILKQSESDKGKDVKEFFGPVGGLLASLGDALGLIATGQAGRGVLAAMPRAIQNAAAGAEMMATGAGHDKYGRKTIEVTPAEAAIKLSGFNPIKAAEESQIKSANMQDLDLVRVRKQAIINQWAYGVAHHDKGEILEARQKLKEWNEKNPELKIRINFSSVQQKAKALDSTGKSRFIKSVPKEMRRRIVDELG